MSQGRIEKLSISRTSRGVFALRFHVRVTVDQAASVKAIAARTGRSQADLIRTAIDQVIAGGDRIQPVDVAAEIASRRGTPAGPSAGSTPSTA